MFRIGEGYDVHRLVENRDLILGGIHIPYELGLLGHSDADVLVHAIIDSILGALAMGDIGKLFPDTDDKYKGISSILLLSEVHNKIKNEFSNANICNIDATIICEKPKMRAYIDEMRNNISKALNISIDCVNVKATTEEGLGFTGEGKGIAARSVCLVEIL